MRRHCRLHTLTEWHLLINVLHKPAQNTSSQFLVLKKYLINIQYNCYLHISEIIIIIL